MRAFTFLARSERQLLQYIQTLDISKSSTTLFTLHTPLSESALQSVFSNVTALPSNNIGCLSGQIHPEYSFCASFLNIPHSVGHHVWRSTIPGREKAQVGRWYSREQMEREPQEIDMDSLPSWREDQPRKVPALPQSLQNWAKTQKSISSLLYLSDDASEGLADALTHHFPRVPKLGLTASSTPFITGRPFTLYESGTFHSSGAVGVALTGEPRSQCEVDVRYLKSVGPPMMVTSSASNMIYTLDETPAVNVLMKHIPDLGRDPHDGDVKRAFLGVFNAKGKLCRTFSISAGSPSRGALLLDGEWAPGNGMTVQFFIRHEHDGKQFDTLLSSVSTPEVRMLCMPQEESVAKKTSPEELEDGIAIDGRFIAASEGGFSMDDGLSQSGLQGIWQCTTPNVAASLTLLQ